ncbi:MAG: HAMP domain-containing histidine kinase [Prevotellaceae bacterium]|jgi:nitrogen-specific signal transduction histidine kinase|nr:HAMP domain-containing histidine kinase [Prevotellaceae bacterium]
MKFQQFKSILIIVAAAIVLSAMYISNRMIAKLSEQETHSMEIWAEATRQLVVYEGSIDLDLVFKILNENKTIPAILVDANDKPIDLEYGIRNINLPENPKEQEEFIRKKIQELKTVNTPIVVQIDGQTKHFVYYDQSSIIKNLRWFSYILFIVVALFLIVAFMIFTQVKKAEQNQVWIGLSRETAHQLGTPISSLLAWVEILKDKQLDTKFTNEISKDVNRLRIIAERFSKIGSKPDLEPVNFVDVLENAVAYLRGRTSNKIVITTHYQTDNINLKLNVPLFEWVVENLCKNAMDAMDGEGKIDITVSEHNDSYYIDFQDTGKGIPKSKYKTVFNPGYTTKKRGWGLGLSLVKRIVEEYHKGKIFVKQSEIGKGTTFRILLKK